MAHWKSHAADFAEICIVVLNFLSRCYDFHVSLLIASTESLIFVKISHLPCFLPLLLTS